MSSIVISGDTSGAITLAAPAVSGTNTATLPAATGTVMVSGNMPTFFGYQNSAQSVLANTFTKVNLQATLFDTNSNFASSRFTPNVAGYYQINGNVCTTTALGNTIYYNVYIAKNGSAYAQTIGYPAPANYFSAFVSSIVYLNGSTDYVELYTQSNSNFSVNPGSVNTFLNGSLVRTA
jgi:hypothetical protein